MVALMSPIAAWSLWVGYVMFDDLDGVRREREREREREIDFFSLLGYPRWLSTRDWSCVEYEYLESVVASLRWFCLDQTKMT
jgi:hypothetical protein